MRGSVGGNQKARRVMKTVKMTKRRSWRMKKISPMMVRPGNLLGVLERTTARAPVDIVVANLEWTWVSVVFSNSEFFLHSCSWSWR